MCHWGASGTSNFELPSRRELNFRFSRGTQKMTQNDPQKWPFGYPFGSLWDPMWLKMPSRRTFQKTIKKSFKNDPPKSRFFWKMGTHFHSFLALDPTWTPTLPSGIKNDDLGPKNDQTNAKNDTWILQVWPHVRKSTAPRQAKVPNQDKQKYRTKTSSQDTPDLKKIAVRMLSHTYPELLSHLLFLSRPGGMRAALRIKMNVENGP